MSKPNQSIFGWNTDDTYEVIRTQSNVIRSAWWVSLREKDTQRWWHGKASLSNEQAHALFDFLCSLSGPALRVVIANLLENDAKLA